MCVCACVCEGVWQARYAWDMCSLGQQMMWRLRQLQLQLQRAQAQVLRVSSAVTVVSRGVAWGARAASLSICVGSGKAVSQSTTYLNATYLWYLESWRRLIGGPTSLSMRLLTKPKLPTLPASGPRKGNEHWVMAALALSCQRGVLTMLALVIALHMIDGTGQRWQRSARSLQLWLWLRLPP